MNRKFVRLGHALTMALLLAGCVPTTPYLDVRFGESVHALTAQQTGDPGAAAKHPAPDGMDGIAANDTMDRYYRTYRTPPPQPNIINIGVGAGNTSR